MSVAEELRLRAEDLRKNKKFRLAIPKYRELWEEHPEERTKWDGWGYATCLLKEKKYDDAYDVCHAVYQMDPNFVFNNGLYAWSIYKREMLKERVNNPENFFRLARLITSITSQNESQSPYTKTVFRVLDYLDRKEDYPADEILEWLGKVDYKKLPTEAEVYTNRHGKQVSPASFFEQYYTFKAKALYKKERYQESIDLCKEAFEVIRNFHNNNDIWLLRRVALSNVKLGRYDLALEQLHDILDENSRWFVMKDIADIYVLTGRNEEAIQMLTEAALLPGETSKKTKMFELMVDLYKKSEQRQIAEQVVRLMVSIEQKKQEPMEQVLLDLCAEFNIPADQQYEMQPILNECRAFWQKEMFKLRDPFTGRIDKLQKDINLGYIKAGGSKNFVLPFRISEAHTTEEMPLVRNMKVSYYVADLFDPKKNRYIRHAVEVTPVPETPKPEKKETEGGETSQAETAPQAEAPVQTEQTVQPEPVNEAPAESEAPAKPRKKKVKKEEETNQDGW